MKSVSTESATVIVDETEEPKSRRQKELESAKNLLDKASGILASVDEWAPTSPRQYPTFGAVEIKFGTLLGVGGFSWVWEVQDLRLKVPTEVLFGQEANEKRDNDNHQEGPHNNISEQNPLPEQSRSGTNENNNNKHNTTNTLSTQSVVESESTSATSTTGHENGDNPPSTSAPKQARTSLDLSKLSEDEKHYDFRDARFVMSQQVTRNGSPRYAIKRLHEDLSELERARGLIDLALEAKYLSVLWHPNIVKMRGYASGPVLDPNFFIIMDRLYEILDSRFKRWAKAESKHRGGFFGRGANKEKLRELLEDRLKVAYDLAAAFWYMHEQKLVYRDIKKENIGFDIRGDVKVFDFGLSKCTSPKLKAKDKYGRDEYGFKLTPRTGSVPYMAPEVADCKPYDQKADVFSFSILLWEFLSLKPAFPGFTRREFYLRVVKNQERQTIPRERLAPLSRMAVKEAWDHDPQKRPTMKKVAALIRGDLTGLTSDPSVVDRTLHMRDRSNHSLRGMIGSSIRSNS